MESTYAEYPITAMASSAGEADFPLYAYDQFPPASNYTTSSAYAEHFYTPNTTFDSFTPQNAYAFQPQPDFYAKTTYSSRSPLYSPVNSVTPSFDLSHPPILSSTSDSGASGPSSISSARASPSLSAINAADWTHHNPSVGSNDSYDLYVSRAAEQDTLFASEKIPGCVGESTKISSSSTFPSSHISSSEHVLHSPHDVVFKTPGTPASVSRSPRITSSPRSLKSSASTAFLRSPFFYHSSGLYAPTLESSCLFPLYCISFPFSFVIG